MTAERSPDKAGEPMGSVSAVVPLKEASIEAVVIRADGTREDLGVVSFYSRNPVKQALWRLRQWRQS